MSHHDQGAPIATAATDQADAQSIARHLAWLGQVLDARFRHYFDQPDAAIKPGDIAAPSLDDDPSALARLIREAGLDWSERLVLLLALAPHWAPQVLDPLFLRNENLNRRFTEFGGHDGNAGPGFMPTGQTAAFVVCGGDLVERAALYRLFRRDHALARHEILRLEPVSRGAPVLSGALVLTPKARRRIAEGGL